MTAGITGGDAGGGGTNSPDGLLVHLPLLSFPAPQNPEDGEQ